MSNLQPQDRQELITLLSQVRELQTEKGRRQILELAGLSEFQGRIDLSGGTNIAVGEIISTLVNYGKLETGEAAIAKLLVYVKTLVGEEQKKTLAFLLNKYKLQNHDNSLDISPQNNILEKQIFISYAWGGESEEIADRVDKAFQERGITIVRDKRDAGFKANIKEFMERIGQGKCVITIISEKYLKSPNCMFELVEIAKNGNFYDCIFPIVLEDAQIYNPVSRLNYIKHWEEKIQELDLALKEVSAANLQGFREDIDLYTEIRNTIASLTDTLRQMNVLTPEIHTSSAFEQLYQAVENKLNQSSEKTSDPK